MKSKNPLTVGTKFVVKFENPSRTNGNIAIGCQADFDKGNIQAVIDQRLKAGWKVTYKSESFGELAGASQWQNTHPILDGFTPGNGRSNIFTPSDKTLADSLTWSESGKRIKCAIVRVTSKNGEIMDRETIGTTWEGFDKHF